MWKGRTSPLNLDRRRRMIEAWRLLAFVGLTMRIDPAEFRSRPLRVHALLHDVPLEDAWAVPLSGGGAGHTIEDLRAVMIAGGEAAPAVVQALFRLRGRIGSLFGWDRRRPAWKAESFANRLDPAVIRKTQSAWAERYGGEGDVESRLLRRLEAPRPQPAVKLALRPAARR